MTRNLTPPAPVTLAAFDAMFEEVKNWGKWGDGRRARHAQLHHPGQGGRRRGPGPQGPLRLHGDPDQQAGGPRQSEPGRASHVADARPARQRERAFLRHVLSRHGEPRRLPYPCRCAESRRLQGQALQRQAGLAAHLARLGMGQHRRLSRRHRRPRRAARRGALPQGRLARARRGGDPRRAGGDREGPGRTAGRGRHPGLPHRPSRPPPGARRLEQRLSAGRPGQGRAACRHRALDA